MAVPSDLAAWLAGAQAATATGTTGYTSPLPGYNVSPAPTSGQGPYGLVPGQTPLPPSTWQQVGAALPGFAGAPASTTASIMAELQGQLSPQVLSNLQNTAASFGVRSGMPGSNAIPGSLVNNLNLLGNIQTTQDLQSKGLQDYLALIGAVGAQQTPQSTAIDLSKSNAQLKAAPDPAAAAQTALANYYAALGFARGPAAGTGHGGILSPSSGTDSFAPPALGFGGAAGVGDSQGFGFGSFGPIASTSTATGSGSATVTPNYDTISQGNFGLDSGTLIPQGAVDTGQQFNPVDPGTFDYLYG